MLALDRNEGGSEFSKTQVFYVDVTSGGGSQELATDFYCGRYTVEISAIGGTIEDLAASVVERVRDRINLDNTDDLSFVVRDESNLRVAWYDGSVTCVHNKRIDVLPPWYRR